MGALGLSVRLILVSVALAFAVALGASRFVPTVQRVEVASGPHLGAGDVLRAARIAPGDPWLWITRWRLRDLENHPWVQSARVIRHWPDTISVTVWERRPALTDGTTTWAEDGVELPHPTAEDLAGVPRLEGWGHPRVEEALELVRLFADDKPEVIRYSPTGFDIHLADGVVFTPDVESLRRQWAAIQHRNGGRYAVYPWGVSKADD